MSLITDNKIDNMTWTDYTTKEQRLGLPPKLNVAEKAVIWFGVLFIGYIVLRALTTTYAI